MVTLVYSLNDSICGLGKLIASLIDKIPVVRHPPITAVSRPHRTLTTADFLPPPIALIVGGSFEPEQSQAMINPTWAIFRISRDRRVPRVACLGPMYDDGILIGRSSLEISVFKTTVHGGRGAGS